MNARLQKMEADGQAGDPAFPKQQVLTQRLIMHTVSFLCLLIRHDLDS